MEQITVLSVNYEKGKEKETKKCPNILVKASVSFYDI